MTTSVIVETCIWWLHPTIILPKSMTVLDLSIYMLPIPEMACGTW